MGTGWDDDGLCEFVYCLIMFCVLFCSLYGSWDSIAKTCELTFYFHLLQSLISSVNTAQFLR